jgi:hypothetical protein
VVWTNTSPHVAGVQNMSTTPRSVRKVQLPRHVVNEWRPPPAGHPSVPTSVNVSGPQPASVRLDDVGPETCFVISDDPLNDTRISVCVPSHVVLVAPPTRKNLLGATFNRACRHSVIVHERTYVHE